MADRMELLAVGGFGLDTRTFLLEPMKCILAFTAVPGAERGAYLAQSGVAHALAEAFRQLFNGVSYKPLQDVYLVFVAAMFARAEEVLKTLSAETAAPVGVGAQTYWRLLVELVHENRFDQLAFPEVSDRLLRLLNTLRLRGVEKTEEAMRQHIFDRTVMVREAGRAYSNHYRAAEARGLLEQHGLTFPIGQGFQVPDPHAKT